MISWKEGISLYIRQSLSCLRHRQEQVLYTTRRMRLRALTTEAASKSDVLGLDGDTL